MKEEEQKIRAPKWKQWVKPNFDVISIETFAMGKASLPAPIKCVTDICLRLTFHGIQSRSVVVFPEADKI